LIGDSAANTFSFSDNSGKNLVYGGGGADVLDFSKVTTTVTKTQEHGATVYTWGNNRVTAFGTFTETGIGTKSAGAIHALFGKKLLGGSLELAAGGSGNSGVTLTLTNAQSMAAEAAARWNALLPSAVQINVNAIDFTVTDLSGISSTALGGVSYDNGTQRYTVTLDDDAAGAGWYIDSVFSGISTGDTEFSGGSGPAGVDLLTVILHEFGHVAGIDHPEVPNSGDLMNHELKTGQRRNPTEEHASEGLASSDKLELGLDAFSNWAGGLGDRIDAFLDGATTIPFTDKSIASLLGVNFGAFGDAISPKIDLVKNAVGNYFRTAADPDTNDLLLALQNIQNVSISADPGTQQYSVSIDLATYSQSIVLDLSSLSLDLSDYGIDISLPFNFGLSTTQSQPLQLTAGVTLDFAFGLDEAGRFYVLDT
ncbi:MAG: hypothetical protein ACK50J_12385, partial [Planctomyces sp.]